MKLRSARGPLPAGCLSDLLLDRARVHELEVAEVNEVEAHLAQCAACQRRAAELDALTRSFEQTPGEQAPREQAPGEGSSGLRGVPEPPSRPQVVQLPQRARAWSWLGGALAAAAALVLWLGGQPAQSPGQTPQQMEPAGGELRSKGAAECVVHVLQAEQVSKLTERSVLHPGDRLRFEFNLPTPREVAIFSRDGAGRAEVYYPVALPNGESALARPPAQGSVRLRAGNGQLADSAIELDDATGRERLLAVFCDAPFALEPLRAQFERTQSLTAAPGCDVQAIEFEKAAP